MGTGTGGPGPFGEERRQQARVRLDTVTQTLDPASGTSGLGRMENLSVGGLRILSRETLHADTRVLVRFNLPCGRPVEARGVVVHAQRGRHMGIQFLEVKDEDRRSIRELVLQQIQPCATGPTVAR